MAMTRWMPWCLGCSLLLAASQARAHFVLQKPASWLNEDELGGPQKGSPCGPGNARPLFGDDVQPVPKSGKITSFHAGETVTVQLQETVYHPGYFRIALARTRAADATTQHFPDPPLTELENCHFDQAAVPTMPHGDVLADGLFMSTVPDGEHENRSLTHDVKLPNEPCENCTLQVIQVMEGHPGSSCFYFHCADITILPAAGTGEPKAGAGGQGGSAGGQAGQTGGQAGASGTAGNTATDDMGSDESDGCTIAATGTKHAPGFTALAIALSALLLVRRRRR